MAVLKAVGITLLAILLFIAIISLLRVRLFCVFQTDGKIKYGIKILFFEIDFNKPKEKKPSRLKRLFGIDKAEEKKEEKPDKKAVSEKAQQAISFATAIATEAGRLFKRLRLDRLRVNAICGGDSAEAAIEYGVCCAIIYPLASYLDSNTTHRKNAIDMSVGCDFENEPYFSLDLIISVRIFYVLKALTLGMYNISASGIMEESNGTEQRKDT